MTKLPKHLQELVAKIEAKHKLFGYDEAAHIAAMNRLADKVKAGTLDGDHPFHAMVR